MTPDPHALPAGRRRLLVIDIGFGALTASAASAARIERCLAGFGFTDPVRLVGEAATAAAIEQHVRALGAGLSPGDAVVVYFVGHGEIVRDPQYAARPLHEQPPPFEISLLVTHDVRVEGASVAGVTGFDLLDWLTPVAAVTDNVTVILDCCHATGMLPRRAAPGGASPALRAAQDRVQRLVRKRYGTQRGRPPPSPADPIVRLVATTQTESSEEGRGLEDGQDIGLFSDAVAHALSRPGAAEIPWDDHIREIQRLVLDRSPVQRPGVEGPRHRLPFSREARDPGDSSPCRRDHDETFTVFAGLAHGVEHGDRFALLDAADPTRTLAEAEVFAVGVAHAGVFVTPPYPRATALRAAPLRRAAPMRLAVRAAHERHARLLERTLPEHLGVALVTADPADALLELTPAATTLLHAGAPVHRDGPLDDVAALDRLLAALARVAHAHRVERGLRELAQLLPAPAVEVAWGDARGPFDPGRPLLQHADALWIRVRSTDHPLLHASAFHFRGDRSVVHFTPDLDHGLTFRRSRTLDVTDAVPGEQRLWPLARGPGVWDERRVRESIVLLLSTAPVSLHGVATPRHRTSRGPSDERLRLDHPFGCVRLEFDLDPPARATAPPANPP